MNLKQQVVEHLVQGLKRPFWKLPHRSGILACRFDPLNQCRGVINSKAALAALPKFSDMLRAASFFGHTAIFGSSHGRPIFDAKSLEF